MPSGQCRRDWCRRRRGTERVDGTGSIVTVDAALIHSTAKMRRVEYASAIATGRENMLTLDGWFISILLATKCTISLGVVAAIRLHACGIEG